MGERQDVAAAGVRCGTLLVVKRAMGVQQSSALAPMAAVAPSAEPSLFAELISAKLIDQLFLTSSPTLSGLCERSAQVVGGRFGSVSHKRRVAQCVPPRFALVLAPCLQALAKLR
jgi:hypothetical protein